MEIIVNKNEIYGKLNNIKGVATKDSYMPILSHFLLTVDKDENTATILATDLKMTVREPLECSILSEGAICIPFKLFEIIKELDNEKISIQVKDSFVNITSKNARFKLPCLPAEDYPKYEKKEDEKINVPPTDLLNLIRRVSYATNDDKYGVLLKLQNEKLIAVATDSYRMSICHIHTSYNVEKSLVAPKNYINEIAKILTKTKKSEISLVDNFIIFYLDDIEIAIRALDINYPNYQNIIDNLKNDKTLLIDRNELLKSLNRVSLIDDEYKSVEMNVQTNKTFLLSSSIGSAKSIPGSAQDEINTTFSHNEPFQIRFNAKYLIEAISPINQETITLKFNTEQTPIVVHENDNGYGYKAIIMPLRK